MHHGLLHLLKFCSIDGIGRDTTAAAGETNAWFDCFAIGVDEKSVSLVTVREKRQLTITLSFLDDDDLTWIVANKDQINRYGPRVLDFVKNYDLKE